MTTGNRIIWKRGEIAPKEEFLLFSTLFKNIFLTSRVKLHIHLLNVVVQFAVFLTLSTLICRGTDISKYFSESLGIRDNESRLYIAIFEYVEQRKFTIYNMENCHIVRRFSTLCTCLVICIPAELKGQ